MHEHVFISIQLNMSVRRNHKLSHTIIVCYKDCNYYYYWMVYSERVIPVWKLEMFPIITMNSPVCIQLSLMHTRYLWLKLWIGTILADNCVLVVIAIPKFMRVQ